MATWDFQSVVEYDRTGNSINYGNGNLYIDHPGTLDDGETVGPGSTTFESGDTFDFTTPTGAYGFLPSVTVTLEFFGTVTQDGVTYVVAYSALNSDIGFIFSPLDALTTNDNLPNIISTDDVTGGDFTTCFLSGTRIETPDGSKLVEELEIEDLILNTHGKAIPVKWIGRQTLLQMFSRAERNKIVEIKAGALGGDLPHTDLQLTADHGMVLDGFVVNAGALVNGDTIRFIPRDALEQKFTVYHIETENHDVILANGAPSETFIDYAGRRMFDNYAEYVALYGRETEIAELDLPRISSARLLPLALQERLKISQNSEQDVQFTGDLSDQKRTA